MSQTITKEIQGKTISFNGVDDALVSKVTEMLDSKIQRGVPVDKIIEEMAKFNYIATEEGAEAGYVAPEPTESESSAEEPKVKAGKKGGKKKAKVVTKPATKEKKGAKKTSSGDLKEKALKIIEAKVADGAEVKDIVAAVQKELKISYANAYYYYGRVYKKK